MKLKVLHLNYNDKKGGAAVAVNRIHECLKKNGVVSKVLVAKKTDNDNDFIGPSSTFEEIKWKLLLSINRKFEKLEKKTKYDSNSYNLIPNNVVKKINKLDFDIVNLHWIGNNLIPINQISKINKKIVWTLHDMWPYTGSEHYANTDRFENGYLKNNKPDFIKRLDVDRFIWNLKKKHYPKNMFIVPTSNWQEKNIKKSILLKNYNFKKINLPINQNFWKPIDKLYARKLIGLPENKKIILIGSDNLNSIRKGNYLIENILKHVKEKNLHLLIFSNVNKTKILDNFEKTIFNSVKTDSIDLKMLYSASDVYLAPSLQESFGQTVLEASCCNLQTVCFNNTGISEIIDHKINGYIANHLDLKDFASGIDWCLENSNIIDWKKNSLKLKNFSYEKIAMEYIQVYKRVLNIN